MKTALLGLAAIGLLIWNLQLSFVEIPKLEKQISSKTESESSLEKRLEEKANQLSAALKKITEIEGKPEAQENLVDNSGVSAKINELELQKAATQESYNQQVTQIDSFIRKGKNLQSQHNLIKPDFKNGNIRTSDADRRKWQEEHDKKSEFYKTEINKLEAQKLELKKKLDSFEAQIDLQILQLKREIK